MNEGLRPLVVKDLVRDEGEVLHAYTDSRGYLTIGVGRLIDRRGGGGISSDESRYLLGNDVDRTFADLDRSLPWWRDLSIDLQRVLVNMSFNLGIGGLLGFKSMLGNVKSGNRSSAASDLLSSLYAKQVGKRAERLAELLKGGG